MFWWTYFLTLSVLVILIGKSAVRFILYSILGCKALIFSNLSTTFLKYVNIWPSVTTKNCYSQDLVSSSKGKSKAWIPTDFYLHIHAYHVFSNAWKKEKVTIKEFKPRVVLFVESFFLAYQESSSCTVPGIRHHPLVHMPLGAWNNITITYSRSCPSP